MYRMILGVAALFATATLGMATQVASAATGDAPNIKCRIVGKKLHNGIVGLYVNAKIPSKNSGCYADGKLIGSIVTWKAIYTNPSQTTCNLSPSKGTGMNAPLPTELKTVHGLMFPWRSQITFTMQAVYNGRKVPGTQITATWDKKNAGTYFICGPAPKITSIPGAGPPVCIFPEGNKPMMVGLALLVREVQCSGVDSTTACSWTSEGYQVATPSPYIGPWHSLHCRSGEKTYGYFLVYRMHFGSTPAAAECDSSQFNNWTGELHGQVKWGPGYIQIGTAIADSITGDVATGGLWRTGSIRVQGRLNPCSNDMRQS